MSCAVDNNAFEVIITPSRKRKRDSGQTELSSSGTPSVTNNKQFLYTNAAFSSTPKKEIQSIIQKFNRFPPNKRRPLENKIANRFPADPCLEVKSICDLVKQNVDTESGNPYEVVRKPPKKKKKSDLEEACFVNTGLNLDMPEKQFNPFEVKRESPTKFVKDIEPQCFINPALNIRSQETTAARNPFEISRINQIAESAPNGIENPGLDLGSGQLRIELPFKPTIGCRVDFSNLTPSKMLAEKLVFSPMNPKTPRALTDISEEESTMDIGSELDRYQLELENSINEANQKKTNNINDRRTFGEKLEDIEENSHEEEEAISHEPKTPDAPNLKSVTEIKHIMLRLEDVETPPVQKTVDQNPIAELTPSVASTSIIVNKTYVKEQMQVPNESFTDDEGIDYDDTEDDDCGDFKAPAPFVRAYRKADPIPSPLTVHRSTESLKSDKSEPPVEAETKSKMSNMIRKSIRKLIQPNKTSVEDKMDKKPLASTGHPSSGHNIMESIRHSLRRKPTKQSTQTEDCAAREVSIIDTSERKMKFKSNLSTDYIKMENLSTERKSLRSSIRKSTRDVKNQIMKSVFHKKNEEYCFSK